MSEIVFAGIAPHPPLLVPEVGGDRIARVHASAQALSDFSMRLLACRPDTVVIISPHSPGDSYRFGAFSNAQLAGDFRQFGARAVALSFPNDHKLLDALQVAALARSLPFQAFDAPLDHGVLVPMYYVHQAGWQGTLLALSFTALPVTAHLEFGAACREAARRTGRKIAFVASADLSHYLTQDGPYHYEPTAHLFDEQVCAAIKKQDLQAIVTIDQGLRQRAGECGYRSIVVAIGAVDEPEPKFLCYEGPYGVGYLTAILKEQQP